MMDTFHYLTVGITVMIAVERYIAICHPMRVRTVCTVRRARTIVVILTVVAFGLRSPKFTELQILPITVDTGDTFYTVQHVYRYNEFVYIWIVTGGC